MQGSMDPVELEILWTRVTAMVDEAATALVRTAFSSIIRDANDYACALFDADYNLFAQSTFGGPGFIGSLPVTMRKMGEAYPPQALNPGDVLITNDPWICTGHLNDIAIVTPILHRSRVVAYAACCAHQADIGGRIAVAETREVFEEGLFIPILKLMERGEPNATAFQFIRANVRVPDYVVGDLRAQVAANDVMRRRLLDLMREHGMADIQALSRSILDRTEAAVRASIRRFREGTHRGEVSIDTFDDQPITIATAVTLKDGEVHVDYTGSTPQIAKGVNVCLNYTASYTTFAVKCAVSPLLPNNEGVLRAIKVSAPEGSILNARFPAAVNARGAVGQFLPEIIFGTLASLMPQRVMAGSGGAPVWAQRYSGRARNGRRFMLTCVARGGFGARPTSDGVSTLAFPSNTNAAPVEVIEGDAPIVFEKKELRRDSAGPGKYRGGFGQHVVIRVRDDALPDGGHLTASAKGGRFHYSVPGVLGGHGAPKGAIIANGERFEVSGRQVILGPGSRMELLLPGGGGYGDPLERDLDLVRDDLRSGLVSPEQALSAYGVVTDASGVHIDVAATERTRAQRKAAQTPSAANPA
ncbi:MAG: hydantoinase B/oxoprolinase family protein [Burkholderiales bacterium]|nr:hydantoinase B/oxoprolinase family protein [Burkholderiales bacterium]